MDQLSVSGVTVSTVSDFAPHELESVDQLVAAIANARRIASSHATGHKDSDGTPAAFEQARRDKSIEVYLGLDRDLYTAVQGPFHGTQYIEMQSDVRRGRVLRLGNNLGLGAQTGENRDRGTFNNPILIVELFPDQPQSYYHRYTDRGVCWITSGDNAVAHLTLQNWLDENVSPEELGAFVNLAKRRANEVIDAVLAQGVEKPVSV